MESAGTPEVVDLTPRKSVTQRFLYLAAEKPKANAILFVGGTGLLRITENGATRPSKNFLFRTRELWVAHGFNVAVPDAPSDHQTSDGMINWRTSKDHATDIKAIAQWLRQKSNVPVWLIGTSRGTISAANGAVRINSTGEVDGLVLTASVTETVSHRPESVFEAKVEKVRVPTLVVHNWMDDCIVTPYFGAERLFKKLKKAPVRKLLSVTSENPQGANLCGPLSAHGFFGIEEKVIDATVVWMFANQ